MAAPAHMGLNFTRTVHHDIYPSIDSSKTDLSQPSKVVLITGSGRGIGRSVAISPSTNKVTKLPIDITNESHVVTAAGKVTEEIGRLDILVNDDWVPILESSTDEYWLNWTVSIKGTYLMLKNFLPLLVTTAEKEKIGVDVLNISSIGAHCLTPGASAYQTTRLALLRLSEFVNVEHGGQGVCCINIHPGAIRTRISENIESLRGSDSSCHSLAFVLESPNGTRAEISAVLIDSPYLCGGLLVWLTKEQKTWLAGRYLSASWDVDQLVARKDEIVSGDKLKFRMVV